VVITLPDIERARLAVRAARRLNPHGAILARAHARIGDPARIAGYCGNSRVLDGALAEWAESYGDQTERDHAALLSAVRRGQIKADIQADDGS